MGPGSTGTTTESKSEASLGGSQNCCATSKGQEPAGADGCLQAGAGATQEGRNEKESGRAMGKSKDGSDKSKRQMAVFKQEQEQLKKDAMKKRVAELWAKARMVLTRAKGRWLSSSRSRSNSRRTQ